jgi:archaemetzincin
MDPVGRPAKPPRFRGAGMIRRIVPVCGLILLGISALRVLSRPEDEEGIGAIRRAGAAIGGLHARKGPPRAGEWLATHQEEGQTFDAYRESVPNRPGGTRTTLYIQPLGAMPEGCAGLVAETADLLGRFYGLPVKVLEPIDLGGIPAKARRVHPRWGGEQVDSLYLLEMLGPRVPADAVAVLRLTATDLWPNEEGRAWNFVFGQASLGGRVGVWSIARLGDPTREPARLRLRTLKVAVHETGHMLGIAHCIAYECGMNGSNHLDESDGRPVGFCPECEMKVWWACRLDPARRYSDLAAFAASHGLDEAGRAWGAARDRLGRGGS